MKTSLLQELLNTEAGQEADRILRSCVHCGFCSATCPTYQLLGDELDSPRGRIYLIKEALEGKKITHETQLHLDRCLTCLSCETTCPSGVKYGRLLDIGRQFIDDKLPQRKPFVVLQRWVLRKMLPYPARFRAVLRLGRMVRPLLPAALASKVPHIRNIKSPLAAVQSSDRSVIVFAGCVQSVATPVTNGALSRVLNRLGIETVMPGDEGCCGAVSQHMSHPGEAQAFMRQNIDAWWPAIEAGAEAILVTASGCGVQIKEYGHLLKNDDKYREKALKVSKIAKDVGEFLAQEDLSGLVKASLQKIAYHSPCTLQHGQSLAGVVEGLLESSGFKLTEVKDSHLCCGSAGTYSILQPDLSKRLQRNKLKSLQDHEPEIIATANIGCQMHIQSATTLPVIHWIELLADNLIES